jgi:hypothetical protein
MHNTRLLVRVSALAFLGLLGMPVASMGQAAPPADINPPGECNITPDTVPNSNPPAATEVTAELLTKGQPCDRISNPPAMFPGNNLLSIQHSFDFYSWLTFVALNAPATGGPIGPNVRTKWEDIQNYRQLGNVMLPHGATPTWGTKPPLPKECVDKGNPDDMVVILEEETFNQPFKSGPLIDQNGHYGLFDILMNKPMFDYMLVHKLYSVEGQKAFNETVEFPSGNSPDTKATRPSLGNPGHMGAVMIKVSWKIMDPVQDRDRMDKFHTVDALVYFPGPPDTKTGPACVRAKLGMIGFHVGHKTDFAPQWIWTTFEHVKNAPDQKDVDAGKLDPPYNFFNAACRDCPVNQVPEAQPWDPNTTLLFRGAFKSQITRVEPILDEAVAMNKAFRKVLAGTVWENYELVSTQWPSNLACVRDPKIQETDQTCAPVPSQLANSTLETFSQGGVPIASSSCMACHNDATTKHVPATASDFTFMLEKAH